MLTMGCGGESHPGVTCGQGTVLLGNQCVVDKDASAGGSGTTERDGASTGEDRSTTSDGMGSSEMRDAADAMGDAVSSGDVSSDATAPSDGAGDAVTADAPAVDATVVSDASTDLSSVPDATTNDAVADPDASWFDVEDADGGSTADASDGALPDDPCPIGTVPRNCSNTCANQSSCDVCGNSPGPAFTLPVIQYSTAYIRLPSRPGWHPDCSNCATPTAYSTFIGGGPTSALYPILKATVEPPWSFLDRYLACYGASTPTQCILISQTTNAEPGTVRAFRVGTNDPNAPARNVKIEPGGGSCP